MNNKNQLYTKLLNLGIKAGDIILIHSDLSNFRNACDVDLSEAINIIKDTLLEILGQDGTLVVPTFNWDFCDGQPYNHNKTRSKVGLFSNNILFDKRSKRSKHPIYSFSAIGDKIDEILNNISTSSFGINSVFHRLHKMNAKIISFDTHDCWTFLHYFEQMKKVKYRYIKKFCGDVTTNDHTEFICFDMFVRFIDKSTEPDFRRISAKLREINKFKEVKVFDKIPIISYYCNDIYETASLMYEKDPTFLLKN